MPPDVPNWLEDNRDAATYIISTTRDMDFRRFSSDRTIRQAVGRSFEIIGEALNRINRADPSTFERITDRRRIIAFRNILVHGYDVIAVEIVWEVIRNQLPRVLEEIEFLLRDLHSL